MRIAVIGTGYVGLVSGACLSDFGHDVVCVDSNPAVVDALREGRIPIYEPGLQDLVLANTKAGRLTFTSDLAAAVSAAGAVFIAVGTPARRGDGHADLSHVYDVARAIAPALAGPTVVIDKSTVPVGTGDEVQRIIREAAPHATAWVVSNPEFLREGSAIEDFKHPDRIVIGTDDEPARKVMSEIYRPLSLNHSPILFTGRRTAELIKYAANAFLATKIALINEIADLCESVGANIQDVAHGVGLDNRIGPKFLHAGPGYGGSCFPKDTVALLQTAEDHEVELRIVKAVAEANAIRKRGMGRKVIRALGGGDVHGKTAGVLGLTFKPNTDDMRESPAIAIIQTLLDSGVDVRAYDPQGMGQAREILPGATFVQDAYAAAEGADVLVIVTEWNQFRALDLKRIGGLMKTPAIVDLRNVYSEDGAAAAGFRYWCVGRADAGHADAEAGRASAASTS